MIVSGPWLEAAGTRRVFTLLGRAGYQVHVVGGAVRDAALGRPVGDVDFATDARPDAVTALAEAAGINAVPTGIDHGTVTLVIGGKGHEVTTWRRDVETDGRRAVVAFAEDMETDARRRDFTMNALYADASGAVIDPLGGWDDLMARRVRFIDDPEARIREDALRILRFFRFVAWYGDPDAGIDAEALAACAALTDLIDGLSAERIGHEMRKLLAAPDPAPALASMAACGVLARVAPGADTGLVAPLVAAEGATAPDWMRRLGALGPAVKALDWRLTRAETKALVAQRAALDSGAPPAAQAYRHGAQAALNAALIGAAAGAGLPDGLAADIRRGAEAAFPLRASDLIDATGAGPALGRALRALEEDWIASDFTLDRADLLARYVPRT